MTTPQSIVDQIYPGTALMWKINTRRDRHKPMVSPADYYSATDRYDMLRGNSRHFKTARKLDEQLVTRMNPITLLESKQLGVIERRRNNSFKHLVDMETADKPTKHLLRDKANEYSKRYDEITESVKEGDKKLALKALKHVHCRLDPRVAMTEVMINGWMVARDKPGGDHSLREAYDKMTTSKARAYRSTMTALAKSRKAQSTQPKESSDE